MIEVTLRVRIPRPRSSKGPLEHTRFLADVHLGKLARRLRLAGLDPAYDPGAELAARQSRILLTRDVGLAEGGAISD
jgi:uncharacterized protein with PIN domain